MEEITEYLNLPVYTSGGTFVGNVENMILDVPNQRVHGLLLGKTNSALVEGGRDVAVPYRWVRDFDDVLLLSRFPESITPGGAEDGHEEIEEAQDQAPGEEVELETA